MPYNTTSESLLHMTGSVIGCLLRHSFMPCSQNCGSSFMWDRDLLWQPMTDCVIMLHNVGMKLENTFGVILLHGQISECSLIIEILKFTTSLGNNA